MRRILSLFLILGVLSILSGCKENGSATTDDTPPATGMGGKAPLSPDESKKTKEDPPAPVTNPEYEAFIAQTKTEVPAYRAKLDQLKLKAEEATGDEKKALQDKAISIESDFNGITGKISELSDASHWGQVGSFMTTEWTNLKKRIDEALGVPAETTTPEATTTESTETTEATQSTEEAAPGTESSSAEPSSGETAPVEETTTETTEAAPQP